MHYFPVEGEYEFRVDPEGNRPEPSDPLTVTIWIDGKQAAVIEDFTKSATALHPYDSRLRRTATRGALAGAIVNYQRSFHGPDGCVSLRRSDSHNAPGAFDVFRCRHCQPIVTAHPSS
jgi:hypothetical protein